MLTLSHLTGFDVEPPYRVSRCPDLDGAADYLYRSSPLAGATTQAKGAMGVWLRRDVDVTGVLFNAYDGATQKINLRVTVEAGGILKIEMSGLAGAGWYITRYSAGGLIPISALWKRLFLKWDMTAGVYSVSAELAGAAVSLSAADNTGGNDLSLGWGYGVVAVGANSAGGAPWNGGLADFWLHTSEQYSATSGIFYDATGKPLFLGDDGDVPTGTPAAIYLRSDYDTWGKNSGTGGDFVMQSTPWAAASTTPSD